MVHGLRLDGGVLVSVREEMKRAAEPVWPEMAAAFRRGNPPATTPVPTGDPRPALARMIERSYVRAAFHVSPDLTLTYQVRGGGPRVVDLRRWRPETFNLGWRVPITTNAVAEARHREETLVFALVRGDTLARRAGPIRFRRIASDGEHRLHARGTRKHGWIGYDTTVSGPEGAEILARHGLGDKLAWSTDVAFPVPGSRFMVPQAIAAPFAVLPPEIDDLELVPAGSHFWDHHFEVLLGTLKMLMALFVATGVSFLVSLRQLRHLMRHRALAEARGRFVSGMSHEMRTPLTTIKLYAEMLQHGVVTDGDARRGYLGTIARECDRLTRLVENVLAYAAMESKARPLVIDPLDARELLEEAVAAARGPLDQAGLTVEVHAPVALRIAADRDAIVLALANLLTNAAKYAADGRVVMLSALPAPDADDEVVITVRDFGPGIPAAERSHIFEPFYRRRQERAPGTGLGLALVQETARGHGGRIEVASEPGEGTEFRLRLPLAVPEDEA
jgi:signal transduction histidine kinase